jgi:hypothetical protein
MNSRDVIRAAAIAQGWLHDSTDAGIGRDRFSHRDGRRSIEIWYDALGRVKRVFPRSTHHRILTRAHLHNRSGALRLLKDGAVTA